MGRSTGLEPATLGTTNRCSNQLSYDRREKARPYGPGFEASRFDAQIPSDRLAIVAEKRAGRFSPEAGRVFVERGQSVLKSGHRSPVPIRAAFG